MLIFVVGIPAYGFAQAEVLVAVEPALKRDRAGGLIVEAQTNLPDGFQVMVTLQSVKGPLLGQADGVVTKGRITAGPFTRGGATHPPGVYIVQISSSMPALQPQSIRNVIGQRGERLTGALVSRGSSGNRLDFSKNMNAP